MILLVPDSLQQYFFRFLQIGRGIDLPDVAVIDTNGGTPFQNPVINSSMCHVRCTIQFRQCEIGCYNQRFFAAVTVQGQIQNCVQSLGHQ